MLRDTSDNVLEDNFFKLDQDLLFNQIMSKYYNAEEGEAFKIVSLDVIRERCQLWIDENPNIRPFYAVKCLPDIQVIKSIASFGDGTFGFDCCSKYEIELVLEAGVSPQRIIYAHPSKPISYLRYARSVGVDLMTFDNVNEMKKISSIYPSARLILRVEVDDGGSAYPLQHKFGAQKDEIKNILEESVRLSLDVVGISFHVGCDATNPKSYTKAISFSISVCELAREIRGKSLEIIDIGGGFPGREDDLFSEIAKEINSYQVPKEYTLIAEPGRFFVGKCISVYAPIFGKRTYEDVIHYHIMDGYYGTLGSDATRFMIPVPISLRSLDTTVKESKIWGPTCDSLDILVKSHKLPELQIGDFIAFHQVGAYTASLSSRFCGFENSTIYYVDKDRIFCSKT